jgi:hypothetical protein
MATIFAWDEAPAARPHPLSTAVQRQLSHWNHQRLAPRLPGADWREELEREHEMRWIEMAFLETLREEVAGEAATAPTDPDGFIAWFEALEAKGPGQHDPLFDWIADHADLDEMRWFLTQEAAGEAGFDDLVAYTQVKLPEQAKLELARNYWDEMGRGIPKGMQGPMLAVLVDALRLKPEIDSTLAESLMLANAMTAMATNRRFAWHSVGALGVVELTAPGRAVCVAKALRRLGLSARDRRYFDIHAILDVKHSAAWNQEALRPLVAEDPARATAMAEGALIRLKCGERCFEAYRDALWKEKIALAN